MEYNIKKVQIDNNIYNIINISNDEKFNVSLLDYGASIYSIYLNDKLLTVTPKDISYLLFPGSPYGKTIGRIAGRIEDAQIDVDDFTYKLEKSKFGKDCLHCGSSNIANKQFDFHVKSFADKVIVTFHYLSLEKEAILPGDIDINVIYTITKDNKITIEYKAFSTKNTYLNITNHTYYNLSGNFVSGAENQYLQINSSKMMECDEDLNPQKVISVDKHFNFKDSKIIKDNLFTKEVLFRKNRGFDDAYILEKDENDFAASLYSPISNIKMNMYTNYPGLVFYSGSYAPFMELIEPVSNKFLYDAICLEAQFIPNGYKIFDKNYMYLKKNEEYNYYIEIEFLKEGI